MPYAAYLSSRGRRAAALLLAVCLIPWACGERQGTPTTPSDRTRAAAAAISLLIANVDTDGDGVLDAVYNEGSSIRIQSSSRGTRIYRVAPTWTLLRVVDADGVAGSELVLNVGSGISILCDRIGTSRLYPLTVPWSLVAVAEMDGQVGVELAVNAGDRVQTIHAATGRVKSYVVGSTWTLVAVGESDGKAGAELWIGRGSTISVIHDAAGRLKSYVMGGSWTFVGLAESDGHPGDEAWINQGSTVSVIHAAVGMVKRYLIGGNWTLVALAESDGRPGVEGWLNQGGTIRVVHDAVGRVTNYAAGPVWALLTMTDLDGRPGAEAAIGTPEGIRVIADAAGSMRAYAAAGAVFMRAAELNALPGSELLFNLGTSMGILEVAPGNTLRSVRLGSPWLVMDVLDTDGAAGAEVVLNQGMEVGIVGGAGARSTRYVLGGSWRYLGAAELDGAPGLELRFDRGGAVYVVNDRLRTVQAPRPPAPRLFTLNPSSVAATTTLVTLSGQDFDPLATVQVYAQDRAVGTVTVKSRTATQIQAELALAPLSPGTYQVRVVNSGSISNPVTLTVTPARLALTSVSPASARAGTFVLTLTGQGFDSGIVEQLYYQGRLFAHSYTVRSRAPNQLVVELRIPVVFSPGTYQIRAVKSTLEASNPLDFVLQR